MTTFLTYSFFTLSQGNFPLAEKIEAFQSAPLATITDEAPEPYLIIRKKIQPF